MQDVFVIEENGKRKRRAKEVECFYCGKLFLKSLKAIRNSKRHCCSIECSRKPRIKLVEVKCDFCGKSFFKHPNRIRSKFNFCNRQCQSDAQKRFSDSNYKCNIREELSVSSYRDAALFVYGATCGGCGKEDSVQLLDVHHIDSNRDNNSIENLIVLCVRCHAAVTRGLANIDQRVLVWVTN